MITVTRSPQVQLERMMDGKTLPDSSETSFSVIEDSPIASCDGKGGVNIHMYRMQPGYPYSFTVDGTPLVIMKEASGDVIVYGFPE